MAGEYQDGEKEKQKCQRQDAWERGKISKREPIFW